MSPQTEYDVQGNPITRTEQQSDEDFTSDQLAAIEVCAANIVSIVEVANQGPVWLDQGNAAAAAAAQSAANAQTAASTAGSAASSAGSSASAASASSTAAATSSSQAATSASGAQTSASAASASADRAEAAASSNPNNPLLVPGNGGLGDTLYRTNSTGTTPVGAWGATRKNLVDFDDVDYTPSAPAEGDRLTWTGGSWKPRTATSSTTLAGLSDVALTTLADLQLLQYDLATQKWKNKTLATAAGPNYLKRGADLVGPLVHDIAVADFDVFYKCAVGSGDVTLNFPQGLSVPVGYRSMGFGKLTGANGTNKVKFTGGAAPPTAMGTFGTVISKAVSAAAPGTPLTNAQNVVQTFTIPTGLKCRLAIAYIWTIPGLATDASDTPGFIWNGDTANPELWDVKDVAPTTRIRGALRFMALGDIPAGGLACSWQPQWTDYGGNRVQAYIAMFIPFYGAELTDVDGIVCRQVQPNATAIDPVLPNTAIGGPFRMATYVVGRRSSSSTDGFVVLTGCTQDLQSNGGGVNKITDNVAVSVGHETAVVGTDSTCHAASQSGTGSFPWVDIHFAFISAYSRMLIRTRNDKAAEMVEANQFFGWLYDPEQNIVDMIF